MTTATPQELRAAKNAIYRDGIMANEYNERHRDIEASAIKAIKEYADLMRVGPMIGLLRIASDVCSGPEKEAIEALTRLLDESDPDAAADAADAAHNAIDAFTGVYW